jgi:hypothetical protein
MLRYPTLLAVILLLAVAAISVAPSGKQNSAVMAQSVTATVAMPTTEGVPQLGFYYERDLTGAPRQQWAEQALGYTQGHFRILVPTHLLSAVAWGAADLTVG